jgi:DnaJ-domain-containing protein 1
MTASIILVIIVAFALGYVLVSWLMRRKRRANDASYTSEAASQNGNHAGQEKTSGRPAPSAQEGKEREYGTLLGLKGVVSKQDVRRKYLEAIAKYHPDKVNHLAPEFQAMAEEKTKALTEAYQYFRAKYGLR